MSIQYFLGGTFSDKQIGKEMLIDLFPVNIFFFMEKVTSKFWHIHLNLVLKTTIANIMNSFNEQEQQIKVFTKLKINKSNFQHNMVVTLKFKFKQTFFCTSLKFKN